MAEAILRHKGGNRFSVKSAGLFAQNGQPANPNTLEVLKDHGISLDHSSTMLTKELVEWADLILTMTEAHRNSVVQQYPEANHKTFTLKGYATAEEDWELWKEAMADYQMKKAVATGSQQSKHKDQNHKQELHEAHDRLQELEHKIGNSDIKDPFGGSKEVYQSCFLEIEKHIDRFIENDV